MYKELISSEFPFTSEYVEVYGSKIHYIEQGDGDPILFLHGIPTSSYLWRNIIPHVSTLGRCIAVDLIGMGKSDKPPLEYTISDYIKYIDKFIEILQLKRVTLILHAWGSIVGFDWAMRNEDNCKALIFYESYIRPLKKEELSLPFQEQLYTLGESSGPALNSSSFINKVLPQGMLRVLTDQEFSHYREPFIHENSEKLLQTYLQELPRGENNSKVDNLISSYSSRLLKSQIPKLMLFSVPGFITTIDTLIWAKNNFLNLEMVEIGEDLHYIQESNPQTMGEAISVWLQGLEQTII